FGNDVVTDLSFAEGDSLTFILGGQTTKVSSLAELNALISSTGATVSQDSVSATITFGTDESVKLIGFTAPGGVIA
ncbi:hypothetical protein J8J40_29175, partial [Mycobacterium tuberculosis]|nr:hypothetical protein [Mycobacterium tuberculosis]